MSDSQRWFLVFGLLVGCALIYLLTPVLVPFLIAGILAYFFNPLVDKLEDWHLPRVLAVTLVFLLVLLLVVILVFLFIPVLGEQVNVLVDHAPVINQWVGKVMWPWINQHIHIQSFDLTHVEGSLLSYLEKGSGVIAKLWNTISQSGIALISFVTNLILVLVVTFYLLCDWERVTQSVIGLFPRASADKTVGMIKECAEVLASFFRGQLLVMISLGVIYGVGLWLVGLDIGLLIGFLAGLLSIVPYLGFVIGILLAAIASLIQFHTWLHLLAVAIVFCIGELAESFVLVPFLVGDRIGLHPVAVIFAILAGGQLFGFVGVLLAVPVAAVIMVFLRHLRGRYVKSYYYNK